MTEDVDDVWPEWLRAVNMFAVEVENWLETDESRAAGHRLENRASDDEMYRRRIVTLLRTKKGELTEDDASDMRLVVGFVHEALARRPDGDVEHTRWRYSLMNCAHDPLRVRPVSGAPAPFG